MRFVVALLMVAACGRSGFDRIDSGDDGSMINGDSSVATPRCAVPVRPDVSNPRITLGCDQIVAAQEVLGGGVIRFDCPGGLRFGSPMLVNKDTIIDGHGVVFDGQGITKLFVVNNNAHLTLLDVTITHGAATDDGAGITLDASAGGLVAFDSTFADNHAAALDQSGGAISARATSPTVEIYGGRFSDNTAASGGAIYSYNDLTIVNATFDNNVAQGTGGGGTGTGGDGGAVQFAGDGDVTLCGDTFASNLGGFHGGALVIISTSQTTITKITDVSFDFNRAVGAGAAYLQNCTPTLRRVSVTSNVATGGPGGGLWFEGASGSFDAENLSVVFNRADGGTGAGIFVSTAGRIAFSTIADNAGTCSGCVQAAVANGANVVYEGTVIVDNAAPTTPVACEQTGANAGANFQWPGDLPLCATGATVTDPFLLPKANATGPAGTYLVRKPSSGSPAIGAVSSGCPAEDLLGRPRPTPCSAGSVEP